MTASNDKRRRYLARHVIVDGTDHGLSRLDISYCNEQWHVEVQPFEGETEATVYYNGTIRVTSRQTSEPIIDFE